MARRGRTQVDLYERNETYRRHSPEKSRSGSDRTSEREVWKGLVSGLIAGTAAAWAMTQYQVHAPKLYEQIKRAAQGQPQAQDEPRGQQQSGSANTTVVVADRISRRVRGREVSERHKELAGNLVHYGFGMMNGGLFGTLNELISLPAPLHGLIFGAGVWGTADELVLPSLGLAKWWPEYPVKVHLNALGAHLVYGTTLDIVQRGVRELLDIGAGRREVERAEIDFREPGARPQRTAASMRRFGRFTPEAEEESEQVA